MYFWMYSQNMDFDRDKNSKKILFYSYNTFYSFEVDGMRQ